MSAFAISHRGELQRCKNTPDSVGGRQLWLGAGEGIVLGDFAPFSPSEESAVLCWGVMSHPIPPPRTSSPSSSVSQPQAAASPVGAVGWCCGMAAVTSWGAERDQCHAEWDSTPLGQSIPLRVPGPASQQGASPSRCPCCTQQPLSPDKSTAKLPPQSEPSPMRGLQHPRFAVFCPILEVLLCTWHQGVPQHPAAGAPSAAAQTTGCRRSASDPVGSRPSSHLPAAASPCLLLPTAPWDTGTRKCGILCPPGERPHGRTHGQS